MQQKKALWEQIKDINKLSLIPIGTLRTHRGVTNQFKFKARNENAIDIETAINSMRNTLYNLIRDNRNNATQTISIGITEKFSKPKEVFNDRDLVDRATDIVYRRRPI